MLEFDIWTDGYSYQPKLFSIEKNDMPTNLDII